jgi:predicted glycoside hydrolase/deacetylase ChbG (UPF0249 family)
VLRAHEEGILTACSVVACGMDFDAAAQALRGTPSLDVGAHLTFVGERPLSPPAEVRSLVDEDGAFLPSYRDFLRRYVAGGIDRGEIARETRRQLQRVAEAGLQIRHVNSHQHLHVLPGIFSVVLRIAAELRVPYIRLPRDAHPRAARFGRWLAVRALALLSDRARAALERSGIRSDDRTIGVMDAGRITAGQLLILLEHVEGVTELVAHPGEGDAIIARRYGWRYQWDEEREALCDPRARSKIAAAGITLGGIRDLVKITGDHD